MGIGSLSPVVSDDIHVSCSILSYQIPCWVCVALCPTPCKQGLRRSGLPGSQSKYAVYLLGLGPQCPEACVLGSAPVTFQAPVSALGLDKTRATMSRSEELSRLATGPVSLTCRCLPLLRH